MGDRPNRLDRAVESLREITGFTPRNPQAGAPLEQPAPSAVANPQPPAAGQPGEVPSQPGDDRSAVLERQNRQQAEQIEALLGHMATLVQATASPPPREQPLPEIQMEPLPKDIDERPAPEQVEIRAARLARYHAAMAVQAENAKRDRATQEAMQPVLARQAEMGEVTDRIAVMAEYPNFRYTELKGALDAKRAEVPGLSAREAAALVAMERDPSMLAQPSPKVPFTLPATPSMQAAQRGPSPMSTPATGGSMPEMLQTWKALQAKGRTTEANAMLKQIFKQKGSIPESITQRGR